MADDSALGEATRDYAEAYAMHYSRRDASRRDAAGALHLYHEITS